ncbi:MAG TPA: A24 family peptidase [Jiangellaceae bacterium]|nr:A24 family peptidase [Jiangellaceae bacterium]
MIVLAAATLGLVAGALLPRLIALIPDRPPEPGEPARTPYRTLAGGSQARVVLAVVTAAAWALLAAARGLSADLPAFLLVATLGAAMAYVDVAEHRLPDWLTYPAFAGAAGLLAVAAASTGWTGYGRAWLGALAMTAGFLVLALLRPGELGLGDVKLAASLGLLLGWIGWGQVLLGAFAAFLLGGLYSVGLLLTGRANRRSQIPFGPFMLAGALITVVWGAPVLDAYLGH